MDAGVRWGIGGSPNETPGRALRTSGLVDALADFCLLESLHTHAPITTSPWSWGPAN